MVGNWNSLLHKTYIVVRNNDRCFLPLVKWRSIVKTVGRIRRESLLKSGLGEGTSPLRSRGFTYRKAAFQIKLTIAFLMLLALLSPSIDVLFPLRKIID